jgi:hypothetical protein
MLKQSGFVLLLLVLCSPLFAQTRVEYPLPSSYEKLRDIVLSHDAAQLAVRYLDTSARWNLQINDSHFGPYDASWHEEEEAEVSLPIFGRAGSAFPFLFWYREQYFYYAFNGGERFGPFDRVRDLELNREGEKFRFAYMRNQMWYLRENTATLGPFPAVRKPAFFQDAERRVYARAGKWYMQDASGRQGPFDALIADPASPVVSFLSNRSWYVRHEAVLKGPFEEVGGLNASAVHMAFWARWGGAWYVVTKNNEYGPYVVDENWAALAELCPPQFSPNPHTTAFRYTDGKDWYMMVNGRSHGPFHGPLHGSLQRDGGFWGALSQPLVSAAGAAYWFSRDGTWQVQLPQSTAGPFNRPGFLLLEDAGAGYSYEDGGGWFVQTPGRKHGPYAGIDAMGYDEQSNTWWFIRHAPEGSFLHAGDAVHGPFQRVEAPVFASSGTQYLYVYRQGDEQWVGAGSRAAYGPYAAAEAIVDSDGTLAFGYVDEARKVAGIVRMGVNGYIRR